MKLSRNKIEDLIFDKLMTEDAENNAKALRNASEIELENLMYTFLDQVYEIGEYE